LVDYSFFAKRLRINYIETIYGVIMVYDMLREIAIGVENELRELYEVASQYDYNGVFDPIRDFLYIRCLSIVGVVVEHNGSVEIKYFILQLDNPNAIVNVRTDGVIEVSQFAFEYTYKIEDENVIKLLKDIHSRLLENFIKL